MTISLHKDAADRPLASFNCLTRSVQREAFQTIYQVPDNVLLVSGFPSLFCKAYWDPIVACKSCED